MVSKTGDDGAIVAKGSTHGFSTMTGSTSPPSRRAARECSWRVRPANSLSITRSSIYSGPLTFRPAIALLRQGSGPMLVAQCQFYLSSRNLWNHEVRSRVTFRDNFIDMHDGLGSVCRQRNCSCCAMNSLSTRRLCRPDERLLSQRRVGGLEHLQCLHRREQRHDLHGPGDCQPFAADSAWSCFAGAVTSSTANSADVRVDVSGDFKGLATHEMELVVVQARGWGRSADGGARDFGWQSGGDPLHGEPGVGRSARRDEHRQRGELAREQCLLSKHGPRLQVALQYVLRRLLRLRRF